jgi:hypothetical protein
MFSLLGYCPRTANGIPDQERDSSLGEGEHDLLTGVFFLQPAGDGGEILRTPIAALLIHDSGPLVTGTAGFRGDANFLQELLQFGAGAACRDGRCGLGPQRHEARLRRSRVRRVVNVYRDRVAVFADDTVSNLVQRVAPFMAAGGEVIAVAGDHGSGFSAHASTLLLVAQSQKSCQNEGVKGKSNH